jgi:hypothetical protein
LTFTSTGSWETWSTKTIDVDLNSGMNTIRITADSSSGGPNIDKIEVIPYDVLTADFTRDGNIDILDLLYFSNVWLTDDYRADIAQPANGRVDMQDWAVFAGQWP